MTPRVRAHIVEHLAGFALVEPAGGLLGGVGRPAYRLTGQAGIAVPLGHRSQFTTDVAQAVGGPPLLRLRLFPKLSTGLAGQLPGLSARLGSHLPALLGGGVGDLPTGLGGLVADPGSLLPGLLLPAAARCTALIRCRHAPLPSWVLGRLATPELPSPTRRPGRHANPGSGGTSERLPKEGQPRVTRGARQVT
ncbi:Protein of unknown function [Micromonospora lupini str. Lupac 08]|uniref:Uncharacterized protein n=1 Tax=Micromonospora lupini str. Lupac 08 TaxID=1150864 RepID=I0LD14_9ACTN|nr:Protein of unknown function [Micromonospora lupini str. Lupac 08]